MQENELRGMLIDVWMNVDMDKFIHYLEEKGLDDKEIKTYMATLDDICLKFQ